VVVAGLCALLALILVAPVIPGSPLAGAKDGLHGAFWFLVKVSAYLYVFMWLRFTFPRYRFDQLMRLGWQFLVPLSIVNVVGIAGALVLHRQFGWPSAPAFLLGLAVTLGVGLYLISVDEKHDPAVLVGEEEETPRNA
jgi:hypothetical protein